MRIKFAKDYFGNWSDGFGALADHMRKEFSQKQPWNHKLGLVIGGFFAFWLVLAMCLLGLKPE